MTIQVKSGFCWQPPTAAALKDCPVESGEMTKGFSAFMQVWATASYRGLQTWKGLDKVIAILTTSGLISLQVPLQFGLMSVPVNVTHLCLELSRLEILHL